jgi:hypothetical protein
VCTSHRNTPGSTVPKFGRLFHLAGHVYKGDTMRARVLLRAAPFPGVMPRSYGCLPSLPTYFRLGLPLFTNKPPLFPATSLLSTYTIRNKRALKPQEDTAVCPIHTLDDDVLLLIFCTFPAKTMQALHDVLTLTHVCRRWRQLCAHCPELWRN